MGILSFILNPTVFFTLLFVVFVISMMVIYSFMREGKQNQESLRQIISSKEELEQKIINLQESVKNAMERLAKAESELLIKSQMYDGLKEQYNEMEKEFEKLASQLEK